MLRLVTAVVLTVALMAVASPAIDDARRDAAADAVRGDLARVESVATDLLRRDEAGARRVVTVAVPSRTWTNAGVERVVIGAAPGLTDTGRDDVVAVRLRGGPEYAFRVGVDLQIDGSDDGTIVLRRPGRHRLSLALRPGGVVTLDRLSNPMGVRENVGRSGGAVRA